MSLESETREIDGYRYTYMPLGSKRGMRLFTQLVQRLGDSVGQAFAGARAGAPADQTAIGASAIGALCAKLDPDFIEHLIDTFAPQSRVELPADGGTKLVALNDILDLHFARRTVAQLRWLEFCLEAQYSDFLGLLKTALSGAGPAALAAATKGG